MELFIDRYPMAFRAAALAVKVPPRLLIVMLSGISF